MLRCDIVKNDFEAYANFTNKIVISSLSRSWAIPTLAADVAESRRFSFVNTLCWSASSQILVTPIRFRHSCHEISKLRLPTLSNGIPRNPLRIDFFRSASRLPWTNEFRFFLALRPYLSTKHPPHRLRSPAHLEVSRLKSVYTVRLWYSLRVSHHLASFSACDMKYELWQFFESHNQRRHRQISQKNLARCQCNSESHTCLWVSRIVGITSSLHWTNACAAVSFAFHAHTKSTPLKHLTEIC